MPAWPGSLPQSVLLSGFSLTRQPQAQSSQPEAGPVISRRRFSAKSEFFQAQMIMTTAQWANAEAFFDDTLFGGSISFDWTHPISGAAITVRFIGSSTEALFIQSALTGDKYLIGMQFEVLP